MKFYQKSLCFIIIILLTFGLSCQKLEHDNPLDPKNPNYTGAPYEPSSPYPADRAMGIATSITLSWSCSDPDNDQITYDIYFGTSSNPPKIDSTLTDTSYTNGSLDQNKTYYWKIAAIDEHGHTTIGPVWSFSTSRAAGTERDFELGNTGTQITMVWIPPGTFMMGAQDGEEDAESDEYPQHEVTISEGFWMGKYEVKQSQWEAVMGSWSFNFDGYPNRPADQVSWNDVNDDFLPEINSTEAGDPWCLPTEAEWEYACRAGHDNTRFWWGDDSGYGNLGDYAWYSGNSESRTHDAGETIPNPWGLYDMHGNVFEFCEDWYDGDYYLSSPTTDPNGPASGSQHVMRGSSWGSHPMFCRSANRFFINPAFRNYDYGFRLVREETNDNGAPNLPTDPSPSDGAYAIETSITLTWLCIDPEDNPLTYDVYFGTSSDPPLVESNLTTASYNPGALEEPETYYWKITASDNQGHTTIGPVWSFSTGSSNAGEDCDFELGNTGTQITMVWIPPGTFMMGAQDGEEDAESDEYPQHEVTITEGFWMGKYEMTQAQWESVVGVWSFAFDGYPDRPAEQVSWNDINDNFLPGINLTETDNPWRLPTEAEWEYACRAGHDSTRFWWGDDSGYVSLGSYAWYTQSTHDVGGKNPNPWGLYDTHGNVFEWCSDWYNAQYYNESPSNDPQGSATGTYRVSRGGGLTTNQSYFRSAARNYNDPALRKNNHGFRIVREAY
ncbi:SUMF1/EgtB/PvdO family nonheme iron enzyme [Calditrichota bacterium]